MRNTFREQPVAGESIMLTSEGIFPYIDTSNTIPVYANEFLTTITPVTATPVLSERKLNGNKTGLNPVFNILIKKIAACLSDIEMALVCNRETQLQFSTNILKGMLLNLGMTTASRLATQMEELTKEGKIRGVRDLLLSIKKVIAHSMQTQQPFKDW